MYLDREVWVLSVFRRRRDVAATLRKALGGPETSRRRVGWSCEENSKVCAAGGLSPELNPFTSMV